MGRLFPLLAMALAPALFHSTAHAAAEGERRVEEVRFEAGRTSTVIKGSVSGYHYVDYQLRAGAGQTLKASLRGSNPANYFNVLPPDSGDAAMYIGQLGENKFDGLLPADGVYTLRVYLMRSAARRNESSHYTLNVAVTGEALRPLTEAQDARIPGTKYHASGRIPCTLPYEPDTRQCDAFVIRQGLDGTATVEVRGGKAYLRRILFMRGKPVASDSSQPMSFSRQGDVTEVKFDQDERLTIVDALVTGG